MRYVLASIGVCLLVLVVSVVHTERCAQPGQSVVQQLCTQTSREMRRIRVTENAAHTLEAEGKKPRSRGAYIQKRLPGDERYVGYPYQSEVPMGATERAAAYERYANPTERGATLNARVGEVRSLRYDGQRQADEALGMMEQVTPELAQDPVLRAGIRAGGAALDAGRAVDHVVGDRINSGASRVEQALSRLRP